MREHLIRIYGIKEKTDIYTNMAQLLKAENDRKRCGGVFT